MKLNNLKIKFNGIFALIFIVSLSTVGYLGFKQIEENNSKLIMEKNQYITEKLEDKILTYLERLPNELSFLSSNYPFQRYILWKDMGDKYNSNIRKQEAIDLFVSFANNKKEYHKIRYLDRFGDEVINIKNIEDSQRTKNLLKTELQNKSNRDYFKETFVYKNTQIYISDIDLNREFGEIVLPIVPVLRFAKSIIDKEGHNHGVFVITIFANSFLTLIKEVQKDIKHREIFLLGKNGEYFFNKSTEKLWGKDLGHNSTLQADNPKLFKHIHLKNNSIYEDENYLYTYKKIYPLKLNHDNFWVIMVKTDKNLANAQFKEFQIYSFLILGVILFIALIFIGFYVSKITRALENLSEYLVTLAKGKIPTKKITYREDDEILKMVTSAQKLSDNISSITNQAKSIGEGDYSKKVILLSMDDNLGKSINNMTNIIQKNVNETEYNRWIGDGISELNKKLSAEMSVEELADESISFICRFLEVGKGVFYYYNADEKLLRLSGSYMYTQRGRLGEKYSLGEGSIGQCAKERKPILLTQSEKIINMGLEKIKAINSYTMPLDYENEICGVIEIISTRKFNQRDEEFLEDAKEAISSILHSITQRYVVENLLDTAKKSEEKLQVQSKNMQNANTELEKNQQELEIANTQMVEQQQQLEESNTQMVEQQQQLEEANAQMEEQQQQLKANTIILEEKNKNLVTSQKKIDEKAKDLERSNKYKSEFLANMSHELRTPLNSIILLSDMLSENRDERLSNEEIKKASIIHSSGNELLRLINDILDLSKIEAGKMLAIVDVFDSTDFADDFILPFDHQAQEKNLKLEVEDRYNNDIINDKDKLGQILRNFLSNSLKFTKEGTIKLIIEEAEDNHVKISIADTGIGIAKDKLKSIFEAFEQADGSTSREYGGTGLGLSISKALVKVLGGRIELESTVGEGSSFSIIIPNLKAKPKKVKVKKKVIKIPSGEGTETITVEDDRDKVTALDKPFLIIEDDKVFADILKEQINSNRDYALIALNGKDGIALAKKYDIKGVMLDLGLPDMDGIDVLKEFKIDNNLRNIPVYVISGEDRNIFTKANGAIGFSHKPISNQGISDVIKQINQFNEKGIKDLLVVEDNETQRESLIEYIGDNSIKSYGVSTIKDAIVELDKRIYDSVIIDLSLPDGTGYDICEHIKKNKIEIPIIIYTGRDLTKDEEKKLRVYTDSIIIKTVSSQKRLLNEVDMFMHRVNVKTNKQDEGQNKFQKIDRLDGKKVLIVDDDIRNIYVLSELIITEGAEVITANNGKEAVDILGENLDIDIVLMDIMMPVMDGYEATKIIKEDEKTKHIPIIAVSAKAMEEDIQKAIDLGCCDYVSKPIKKNILINIVKSWLGKK